MFGESGIGFLKWRRGPSMRLIGYPWRNVKSCSGHSPPLSQTWQSSGWLTSSNSRISARACTAVAVWVFTTMPSATGHDLAGVALVPQGVVLVLAVEVAERGIDDPARRVAKATEAAAVLQRVRDPAEVVELDLRPVVGEDDLVHAGLLHVAADRQQARAGRLLGPELGVLGAAHVDDRRHGGQRLHVVEQRRPAPRALDGGEGGTRARLRALALERLEQRRLLAADLRAVAAVDADVERVLLAHRLRPEIALVARLADRLHQHPVRLVVLAADVDPCLVGADRVGRDHDALEHHVRRVLEDVAVLRRARLRLVRVDDDVLRLRRVALDEAPLHAGRESSPSSPAKA